jgi:predicted metal-dependent hydrolase
MLTVTAASVRAPRAEGAALLVPPEPERAALRIATFLKSAARLRLAAAADRHAGRLGRNLGRLTLRDTRSRWGSCTASGDLMFSWRLVMAPPAVLDYVVAHEVAHFEEMNHSPAFWSVVARLCPDHRSHRKWLRREGATLHRYRFGD